MNKNICSNEKENAVRAKLISLAREHCSRQMRCGFSVLPDFDSMSAHRCADGSVLGVFDNVVDFVEVRSGVSLSAAEVAAL